jgi:hypothetical protein
VGVPEICPVAFEKVSPVGREPVIAQEVIEPEVLGMRVEIGVLM